MIKANELRIGNRVLYKPYGNRDGEEKTIAWIYGMKAGFNKYSEVDGMLHHLQGIPLTEEWLERMGFQLAEKLWEPSVGDAYGDLYYKSISIIKQERTGGFHLLLDGGPYEHEYGFPGIQVTTVHQLQNLYFSLTGEELTIKEMA